MSQDKFQLYYPQVTKYRITHSVHLYRFSQICSQLRSICGKRQLAPPITFETATIAL